MELLVKNKMRADLKVSNTEFKSSEKVIKRISELEQFDCQGITENFWQSVKVERNIEGTVRND